MKKFAIVLSGNGVYDGAEIHESVMTMLAVDKNGGYYEIFAPDIDQHHVINHITGEEMQEKRNVLIEASRIARGQIKELSKLNMSNFDALIFPGGFGVAKNLCTYAFEGIEMKINPMVEKLVKEAHQSKKPIGALCISPVLIGKILGDVALTIGQDEKTKKDIESFGGTHQKTTHGEVVTDKKNLIVSTPCYMLDAKITDIEKGADNAVKAMLNIMA